MFKLLIVDDEHIVRMALRSLIDWKKNGIEIVGEAINGLDALNILKEEPVDLIITDINMPVMNGIELIKELRRLDFNMSVIVLSAYNDYDYVREAFKVGVKDYILKSELDPEAILALVKKTLSERVSSLQTEARQHEHYQNQTDYQLLLKAMAEGNDFIDPATYKMVYSELGFKGDFSCCVLVVDEFTVVQQRYGTQDILVFSKHVIESINFQLIKEKCAKVICIQANTYLILYCGLQASEAASQNKLELILRSIQKSLKVYLDISVSIGVVKHCSHLKNLHHYYLEAFHLAELRYLYGKGRIIYQKSAELIKQIDCERILGQELGLIEAIKDQDPNRVDRELDTLLNKIATYKSKSIEQLTGYYLELILIINLRCNEIDSDIRNLVEHNFDFFSKIKQFETKEAIHLWVKNYVHLIMAHLSEINQRIESNQIKRAKKFIVKHYMTDIGLSDVAAEVELSESYLSKLFVAETGETFIHFMTRYRINKACELLSTSNLKIYEIGKLIGYDNVEHFSRVFKKIIGFSPIEYKKHSKH